MPDSSLVQLRRDSASTGIRLQTLILLRWAAVAGQGATILVSASLLEIDLPLGLCLLVLSLSVIVNLVKMSTLARTRRLSESEALGSLSFDLLQLAALLALTGGLHNPFALLIVAPVTIAATALGNRSAVALGALTLVLITLVMFRHMPLVDRAGRELAVPPLFEFGFWLSICIGVVFLAFYARRVAAEIRSMSDALLATQIALAREQKLTDLGGVVAAAAHELGTPLATIKLVSSEMIDDLGAAPDLDALRSDAVIIRDQADRCRDILRSMGKAGKDDLQMRAAPMESVLREAAEPHAARGKSLNFTFSAEAGADPRQPNILRPPEVIHGLRNLVQNAVDFAAQAVWVDSRWSDDAITVWIQDDGPGYPTSLLKRIGEPFLRSRPEGPDAPDEVAGRSGYDGMGLGLFIAKTLLERSGATLDFANGSNPFLDPSERPERSGAIVCVSWPRARIEVDRELIKGDNAPFLP